MLRRRPPAVAAAVLPVVMPLEKRVLFDATYFNLASGPLQQNWSNTDLITTANDWSGVPSIQGFLGDGRVSGTDPRAFLDEPTTTLNVTPNLTAVDAPSNAVSGGVYEFENPNSTSNPTVGMQGSSTADSPNLKIYLNTTGQTVVPVSYNLRDLDNITPANGTTPASPEVAVQQFIAQYRVGSTGNFTNIDASYVADASADGATLVTPVSFNLPAAALNQPNVELRIMTANAQGSDAMIGVDDIVVGGAAPNTFTFDPSSYAVNEAAGTISLTVSHTNTSAAGTVNFATADGSATAGSDFTASSGTLTFAAGVASQTITVPITNDTIAEALEQFSVVLTSPTGGTLGAAPTATVTIADNDSVAPTGVLVNEVSANPPSTDNPNEYIEVRGSAGQKLLNVYALSIEGDALSNTGAITGEFDLSTGTIGSNGLLVLKGGTSTLAFDPATGVVNNSQFDNAPGGALQNGANSYLLVYSPNAVPTGDLDLNNDGVIDNLPAGATVLDGVGYVTSTTGAATPGDIAYGAVLPALTSTLAGAAPDAVTRLPGNTTAFSAAAFYGGDLAGADNTSLAYVSTDPTRVTPNTPANAVLTPGGTNFGTVTDTTPPTVTTTSFIFDVGATPMSLAVDFSENVQASLTASDIVLQNLTTNTTIPTANIVISGYNTTTDVATITFTGYANGPLPDGSYKLTLAAGSVSDTAGNPLAAPYTFNFYTLAGDANRDHTVNFNDFLILQNNFGQTGRTFTQGDFNYDGTVNFNDFLILQNNFNTTVTAAPAAPVTVVSPVVMPAPASKNTASLTGVAFNDSNKNGKYDKGDSLAAGKTIWLDLDNDGIKDANEPSTVTDAQGKYSFKNLAAGTYHVRRVFSAGYVESTPAHYITLATGQASAGTYIGSKLK